MIFSYWFISSGNLFLVPVIYRRIEESHMIETWPLQLWFCFRRDHFQVMLDMILLVESCWTVEFLLVKSWVTLSHVFLSWSTLNHSGSYPRCEPWCWYIYVYLPTKLAHKNGVLMLVCIFQQHGSHMVFFSHNRWMESPIPFIPPFPEGFKLGPLVMVYFHLVNQFVASSRDSLTVNYDSSLKLN